jgi:hypothetical protein
MGPKPVADQGLTAPGLAAPGLADLSKQTTPAIAWTAVQVLRLSQCPSSRLSFNVRGPDIIVAVMGWRLMMSARTATQLQTIAQ